MEGIYSMLRKEIDIHLKQCGLNIGYKASLPPYLRHLTGKYVSENIRYQIITIQVLNMEYYDGHQFPLPATLLKTIKNSKYISEDPYLTYRTSKKGLALLWVKLLDD